MTGKSKIEWTEATWNPVRARLIGPDGALLTRPDPKTGEARPWWGYHCEHVSPGCAHCYAETMNKRGFPAFGTLLDYKPALLDGPLPPAVCDRLGVPHGSRLEVFLDEDELRAPLAWRKPRTVFVCSMTDLFARFVTDAMIDRIIAVMALAPQHTFQVLTKRADRMRAYMTDRAAGDRVADAWRDVTREPVAFAWPLPNVWLGVSVEDQRRANERIPNLLATPAAVRFVSAEPLLGAIDLTSLPNPDGWGEGHRWLDALGRRATESDGDSCGIEQGIAWVIAGGESGPNARPMHPDWARGLRDQCAAAGVPFFFKQWGEWAPIDRWEPWRRKPMTAVAADGRPVRFDEAPEDAGGCRFILVGKKHAGRLLDGRTWDEMPGEGR